MYGAQRWSLHVVSGAHNVISMTRALAGLMDGMIPLLFGEERTVRFSYFEAASRAFCAKTRLSCAALCCSPQSRFTPLPVPGGFPCAKGVLK